MAIKALYGTQVLPLNVQEKESAAFLQLLRDAASVACDDAARDGIFRARPNEAGNDMEGFVRAALTRAGIKARKTGKTTGYPDLEVDAPQRRTAYIDVKTYSPDNAEAKLRTFYMSPSDNPKVTADAHHLIFAYEMVVDSGRARGREQCFTPIAWTILDLHAMPVKIKLEFQTDNATLYGVATTLASGKGKLAGGQGRIVS